MRWEYCKLYKNKMEAMWQIINKECGKISHNGKKNMGKEK
jgi:hypothetical protein